MLKPMSIPKFMVVGPMVQTAGLVTDLLTEL